MEEDVRNNSAWSFRYFFKNREPNPQHEPATINFVTQEINEILTKWLPLDYSNEAAWVYLRGLLCSTETEAEASK